LTARSDTTQQIERSVDDLYRRPGFLIRRAHQISVALFLEETASLGITTTQYGAMVILRARRNLDQVGLAKLVGIDRSTTALVVGKLEVMGYVIRDDDPADRRRKMLVLTKAGHDALDRIAAPAKRARKRALNAFTQQQAKTFLDLLFQ
jgi:DNA-binding MarR family transcriptional regulator